MHLLSTLRLFAIIPIFLSLPPETSGQISEKEVIGTFKPVTLFLESSQAPQNIPPEIETFETALMKSTFTFEANHFAKLSIPIEDFMPPKTYWKFDSTAHAIDIIEWEDRSKPRPALLVRIVVQKKQNYLLLVIEETPYGILVQKPVNPPSPLPVIRPAK